MIYGSDVAMAGCKYLGTPYSVMDCQAFVEAVLKYLGDNTNLPGSNAWYRKMTWTGTPEECRKKFGKIPAGAFLFILKNDGGEPEKYRKDGIGNASHIGIYNGMTGKQMVELAQAEGNYGAAGWNFGGGAIHSSSSRAHVCTSTFQGKSIPGGWNRVGLWDRIQYDGITLSGKEAEGGMRMGESYTAIVTGGGRLNIREARSASSKRLGQLPEGAQVTATDVDLDWAQVEYNGIVGYVMSMFLQKVEDGAGGSGETCAVPKAELQKIYDTLGDWLGLRG